jgi:fumarate hydratase class II
VDGIEPNKPGLKASAENTLAAATALNPHIGYDKAGEIVKEAAASGRSLREVAYEAGVSAKIYAEAMDLKKMALGDSKK